jgi:AraC-like DNA-binding protein
MDRILPSGDMSIIINLRGEGFRVHDETFPGAIVSGAFSEYFTIDTAQQAYTLGIHFKPGGAFPFLNMPAGELEATHVALSELWGGDAFNLEERLLAAATAAERIRIVEESLLKRIGRRTPHPAVRYALREIGRTHRVADLMSNINLSPKRFADVFRNEVGLTPKRFCRIQRFQHALRQMNEGKRIEWADFALSNGYYDQPHFIHDFHGFSGMNPSEYVDREPAYFNHVALKD